MTIFVPAWGWVGSQFSGHSITLNVRSFRPRLGMGWFEDGLMFSEVQQLFSSPSGDGLVQPKSDSDSDLNDFRPRLGMGWFLNTRVKNGRIFLFSSPLGDGLVPTRRNF